MFSRLWPLPRAVYQRAETLLAPVQVAGARSDREAVDLHRAVSSRLALLDAIEGHVPEARAHLGPDAPQTEAKLLEDLAAVAHEELHNEPVALELLRRARDLAPADPAILADLAEVYLATGQYPDFARTASKVDAGRASPDNRVVLAALDWAAARLTRAAEGVQATRLARTYAELASDTHIGWTWDGIKHALSDGRCPHEQVEPILDVIELLGQTVTSETRARLSSVLQRARTSPVHPRRP